MEQRDYLLFAFTAVVGLFCGAYIYFAIFVPTYVEGEPEEPASFAIFGAEYGACRSEGCPSFALFEGRRFEYFNPTVGSAPEVGTYPAAPFNELWGVLTDERLRAAASSSNATSCADSEYTYQITILEEQYSLDTCTTRLNDDPELASALQNIGVVATNPNQHRYNFTFEDIRAVGLVRVVQDQY